MRPEGSLQVMGVTPPAVTSSVCPPWLVLPSGLSILSSPALSPKDVPTAH